MTQTLFTTISNIPCFKKLAILENNIRNKDALTGDVEQALKEKYAVLGRKLVSERTGLILDDLSAAEEKIVSAVAEYVGLMKRDGKTANRTFQMLSNKGLIESAEVSVSKSKPTQGFKILEEADLSELSFEQIIVDHADEFSDRALWFARRALGLLNESEKPPASQESITQKRTEIVIDWLVERLQLNNGVLMEYTNTDVGKVSEFDDLSKHGRVLGNITSRIDFACYLCGYPPFGLVADQPFHNAWGNGPRGWPFPIEAMQQSAQTKNWKEEDLEKTRIVARRLPGTASIPWKKELTEKDTEVKNWAYALKAQSPGDMSESGPSDASVIEETAEQERNSLDDTPEIKFQVGKTIERGPMGRRVKMANNFKCQICEALGLNPFGFKKPGGEHYVEAHHVTPVSELQIGSLAADNIMTLCANHHRQMHYGGVSVNIDKDVFEVNIDEECILVKRHSFIKT